MIEIALTEQEAGVIRQLLSKLTSLGREGSAADERNLHELARLIHGARRERSHFFPARLFGDTAWDMILALYHAEGRGERLSISALGQAVAVPQSTSLRWTQMLEEEGLVERCRDQHDRRRQFVRLTEAAREKVTHYLARVAAMLFKAVAVA